MKARVRCDECGWTMDQQDPLDWHGVACPACRKGVIVNDEEAAVVRRIERVLRLDGLLRSGMRLLGIKPKLTHIYIDTAETCRTRQRGAGR
jgi:hypothetical protein